MINIHELKGHVYAVVNRLLSSFENLSCFYYINLYLFLTLNVVARKYAAIFLKLKTRFSSFFVKEI